MLQEAMAWAFSAMPEASSASLDLGILNFRVLEPAAGKHEARHEQMRPYLSPDQLFRSMVSASLYGLHALPESSSLDVRLPFTPNAP